MNDVRGFLLIDKSMNTVIIPWDMDELIEALRKCKLHDSIKPHAGLKTLDADVRAYLKDCYQAPARLDHPEFRR